MVYLIPSEVKLQTIFYFFLLSPLVQRKQPSFITHKAPGERSTLKLTVPACWWRRARRYWMLTVDVGLPLFFYVWTETTPHRGTDSELCYKVQRQPWRRTRSVLSPAGLCRSSRSWIRLASEDEGQTLSADPPPAGGDVAGRCYVG